MRRERTKGGHFKHIYARVEVSIRKGGGEERRKARETHGVHALIAPSIWWAEVALAIDRLATTVIFRLVFATIASAATDPLDIGALVVVRHAARPVVVIDFCVVSVATDAVEARWWFESREKGG